MNATEMDKETLEWAKWTHERAKRYNQRIPENGWLYMSELSGPDGAHYTLFPPGCATDESINQAKGFCRNHWDCTGFTIITGIEK